MVEGKWWGEHWRERRWLHSAVKTKKSSQSMEKLVSTKFLFHITYIMLPTFLVSMRICIWNAYKVMNELKLSLYCHRKSKLQVAQWNLGIAIHYVTGTSICKFIQISSTLKNWFTLLTLDIKLY